MYIVLQLMSTSLILVFITFIIYLFAQFGGKLTAKNSLSWWLVFAFLAVAIVSPTSLSPIVEFLGIQLVSNFVLGTMIVLLIFQTIQESVFSTLQARKLRELVSSIAAKEFLQTLEARSPQGQLKSGLKKALVVLPCFNEAQSIPKLIEPLNKMIQSQEFEIHYCFVNDGSQDATAAQLSLHARNNHTTHYVNIGVSGALLTGFKILSMSNFDYVVQCDSDGQHPIETIPNLLNHAETNASDLLIGSRFKSPRIKMKHQSTTVTRRLGSLLIIGVLQIFGRRISITDPTSGFRVYSKKACAYLSKMMPDEYPEPETIALLALSGAKIDETQVEMYARNEGVSSLQGIRSLQFMLKVLTALLGLRLRTLFENTLKK